MMSSCKNKKMKRTEEIKLLLIQISLCIVLLILWEAFARFEIINEFLISKPSSIAILMYEYLKSGEIFKHMYISVLETSLGIILGSIIGIIIASILWYFPYLKKILNPFLVVLNALPKTALAPIMIIWAGTGVTGVVIFYLSCKYLVYKL